MSDVIVRSLNPIPQYLSSFRRGCRAGKLLGWSARKSGSIGDLYLFYWQKPESSILGMGVAASEPKSKTNEGQFDWTNKDHEWFRDFKPALELDVPIRAEDIKTDPTLLKWWRQQRPYQGSKKSIADVEVRRRLLELIVSANPSLTGVIKPYLGLRGEKRNEVDTSIVSSFTMDDQGEPPPRVKYTATRVVRNTAMGESLKRLYHSRCQVCDEIMRVPGGRYCEVHHLRPLGGEHSGPDRHDNMLVLCPTCHAMFDLLALAVDPSSNQLVGVDGKVRRRRLTFKTHHHLASRHVQYHWERFCGARRKRRR